jgi:hypothetical protein
VISRAGRGISTGSRGQRGRAGEPSKQAVTFKRLVTRPLGIDREVGRQEYA